MQKTFLLGLLCVWAHLLSGQNSVDSLQQIIRTSSVDTTRISAWQSLAKEWALAQPDSALEVAQKARYLAEEINWPEGQAESYYQIARLLMRANQLDTAKWLFEQAIPIAQELDAQSLLGRCYYYLANCYSNLDNYESSYSFYGKALPIFEELGDEPTLMRCNINYSWVLSELGRYPEAAEKLYEAIRLAEKLDAPKSIFNAKHELGYVQMQMGNLDDALQTYNENEKLAEQLDEPYKLSVAYGDLGLYYNEIKQYERALEYDLKDLAIQQELGNTKDLPLIYNNIGANYLALEQFENAIQYFESSLQLESQHRDVYNNILSEMQLGRAYGGLNQFPKARRFVEASLKKATTINNTQLIQDARKLLVTIYEEIGDYQAAHEVNLAYHTLKDSLLNSETKAQLGEIETKYETEKKEQEILLLEKNVEITKARRNQLALALFASILLAGIIIFAIWQKRRKDQRILTQQKELEVQKRKTAELENEKLAHELAFKKRELAAKVLQLCKKNEFLQALEKQVAQLADTNDSYVKQSSQKLVRQINRDIESEGEWEEFLQTFTQVHRSFLSDLQQTYGKLTKSELRLACLLKMNLSSKEISQMLNVSTEGVKKARYRLRKKLNLSPEENLTEHLIGI